MGAWIEISVATIPDKLISVAPLVGAWIEILHLRLFLHDIALSLPSWERGLKYQIHINASVQLRSLPSWERGLKSRGSNRGLTCLRVAPLVGAWIEMLPRSKYCMDEAVAPLVGAWIEIGNTTTIASGIGSLPSWERGLKYLMLDCGLRRQEVAPLVGAWIEIFLSSSGLPPICCRSPRGSAD